MLANLDKYKIILGSNSPRRKELLSGLDLDFEVRVISGLDESYPASLKAEDIPVYLAEKKAQAYLSTLTDNELVITADTIVWTFEKVMEKPRNRAEAISMLHALSNHVHEVITGVCITTRNKKASFIVSSAVCFCKLSKEEIEYYVDKYTPLDKAGGYGIQEWLGYIAVEAINGSFYNVMGLPVQRLYQELKNF